MPWSGFIRRYEDGERSQVRELFIGINRELAPAALRERFTAYIDLALREEIDRIGEYYDPARGSSFWVAVDGPSIVGTVGLEAAGPRAIEVRRMYVHPERRRQGLVAALLAHAERTCRLQGASRIVLSTSELQSAAIALYTSAGHLLLREGVVPAPSNKTIGGGLRRFAFEKDLLDPLISPSA